ncbi:MAG: RluA family pseudouridine synthase [Chloracidobacterium sp.]|nr:RluA family pseudouridine synthase [Chloracidobacterium sp.]
MTEEPSSFILHPSSLDTGKRLDAYLAENIDGWSRSRLQRLIENEDVLVNEAAVKPSYRVRDSDEIEVDLIEVPVARFEPEDITLDIVYEDEYLAVINKPAGMVVHPGAGVQSGTLANAIAFHFGSKAQNPTSKDQDRVGIVHRLDKDTSGLIVVAKTDEVHEALSEQFRERLVYKSYVALVHGSPDTNTGKIEAPIGRNKHNRLRMKVATHGRSALSLWKVRKRYAKFTLLDVEIKTGRTHQIRVHMGYINHPVVGDEIYNEGRDNTVADTNTRNAIKSMGRFFLHAEKLSFTHPVTEEQQDFSVPLPLVLLSFLETLENGS